MLPNAEMTFAKEEARLREAIPGFVFGNPADNVANDDVTEKFIARQAAMLRQVKDERDCFAALCAENFGPPCIEFNWSCTLKDKRGLWSNVAGCPRDRVARSDCYLRFVIAEIERKKEVVREISENIRQVEHEMKAGQP